MRINVLFVCYGNICRSPLAEFVFKDMVRRKGLQDIIHAESAGTSGEHLGDPVDRRSAAVMAKHGISCAGKTSMKIEPTDFSRFDYILGMDRENMDFLHRMCPDPGDCIVKPLLYYAGGGYVDDPYFTLDFDRAYAEIESGCRGLLEEIEKRLEQ